MENLIDGLFNGVAYFIILFMFLYVITSSK